MLVFWWEAGCHQLVGWANCFAGNGGLNLSDYEAGITRPIPLLCAWENGKNPAGAISVKR